MNPLIARLRAAELEQRIDRARIEAADEIAPLKREIEVIRARVVHTEGQLWWHAKSTQREDAEERQRRAFQLWQVGAKLTNIGRALGCGPERARQLVNMGRRISKS